MKDESNTVKLVATKGVQKGVVFLLKKGELVAGQCGTADIHLVSEAVAWKHVKFEVSQREVFVSSLCSLGATLNGGRLSGRQRLSRGDLVALAPDCELQFVGCNNTSTRTYVLLSIVVLLAAALFFLLRISQGSEDGVQKFQNDERVLLLAELNKKVKQWSVDGIVPTEFFEQYKDALLTTLKFGGRAAVQKWRNIEAVALSLKFSRPPEDTFALAPREYANLQFKTISIIDIRKAQKELGNSDERFRLLLIFISREAQRDF